MTLEHPTPSAGDIGEPEPADGVDADRRYEQRVEQELERVEPATTWEAPPEASTGAREERDAR